MNNKATTAPGNHYPWWPTYPPTYPHYPAYPTYPSYPVSPSYGWICMGCGRGYSPFTSLCFYCGNPNTVTAETK